MWTAIVPVFLVLKTTLSDNSCDLPAQLIEEIQSYDKFVEDVIAATTVGDYSGRLYDSLSEFVDQYGNRMTGTENLESSIRHLAHLIKEKTKDITVEMEPVEIPAWSRGTESAVMYIKSQARKLRIKGLGYSGNGIRTGNLFVVNNFQELDGNATKIPGKIVLINPPFVNYSTNAKYRILGPAKASSLGAFGVLLRSLTPFSVGSHHTGYTNFTGAKPIPAAVVTLEDADMLERLFRRKKPVKIKMKMSNSLSKKWSNNLISDIRGVEEPNSFVSVSGHIDSWDVGQGALDDGGGALLALHTLFLVKHLNVETPRRTIRSILWTGEEEGLYGAKSYSECHTDDLLQWSAAIVSDNGLYKPLGFDFVGNKDAKCILEEIVSLFEEINATQVVKSEISNTDLSVFQPYEVPILQPKMSKNNYFWFHHSEGDSMRVMDSSLMDENLALVAGTAYILANLSIPLPRGFETASYLLRKINTKLPSVQRRRRENSAKRRKMIRNRKLTRSGKRKSQ